MAKKTKREQKREQREREAAEREAAMEHMRQRRNRLRIAAIALPLVTLGVALGVYFGTENSQLAALIGLIGMGLWVPILLGLVGGSVKPRDRTRAGSIDFGNKR